MPKRTYSDEELKRAVSVSESWKGVHRELSLRTSGSSYKNLQRLVGELEIDVSHFTGQSWSRGKTFAGERPWGTKRPLEELLIVGSVVKSSHLKKRLVAAGRMEDRCVSCGQGPEWNGEPLTLQLDHVNGVHEDNRFENLRILCPNCHTQTATFGSKKRS